MSDRDLLLILLRILVYIGSIAAAGSVLFAVSFPHLLCRLPPHHGPPPSPH